MTDVGRLALGVLLSAAALAGCIDEAPGERATWKVDPDRPPTAESTTFTALVTRTDCNGGETGEVREPAVEESADEVVVTFTVEPNDPGFHECPGNQPVPSEVELTEPLGERDLVDGSCPECPVDEPTT